jgi:hypothetical protein
MQPWWGKPVEKPASSYPFEVAEIHFDAMLNTQIIRIVM